jgi:hypothetical protein
MPVGVFNARNARISDSVKPKSGALDVDLAWRRRVDLALRHRDLFECIILFWNLRVNLT